MSATERADEFGVVDDLPAAPTALDFLRQVMQERRAADELHVGRVARAAHRCARVVAALPRGAPRPPVHHDSGRGKRAKGEEQEQQRHTGRNEGKK
jgi:hypothetical protein